MGSKLGRWVAQLVFVVSVLASTRADADPDPTGTPPSTEPAPPAEKRVLVVGTHHLPPFIVKAADGTWSGISIDLLKRIADEMNATLSIRDLPVPELIAGTNTELDITASVNVTPKSELKWELSHSFYFTGLAIAIPEAKKEPAWTTVKRLFSGTFLWLLGGTLILLTGVGVLMWWVEKRPVPEVSKEKQALGKSLFWAFEPVIGYRSSQHSTRAGRVIGTMWGLFGVILISGLTANLSSQLTVHQLTPSIQGPDDLAKVHVGTVIKSAGSKFCERRGLRRTEYDDPEKAMAALEKGDVDAVVYEAPILAYHSQNGFKKTKVLQGTFVNHGYAFGLRPNSPIRREFNKALLDVTSGDDWSSMVATYLGRTD